MSYLERHLREEIREIRRELAHDCFITDRHLLRLKLHQNYLALEHLLRQKSSQEVR